MRKFLITGITGQIGKSLLGKLDDLFSLDDDVFLLKNDSQIELPETKIKLHIIDNIGTGYDLAIHLAAISDINYCQNAENKEEVWETNVVLTKLVCKVAKQVILVSTDYVFNGELNLG